MIFVLTIIAGYIAAVAYDFGMCMAVWGIGFAFGFIWYSLKPSVEAAIEARRFAKVKAAAGL